MDNLSKTPNHSDDSFQRYTFRILFHEFTSFITQDFRIFSKDLAQIYTFKSLLCFYILVSSVQLPYLVSIELLSCNKVETMFRQTLSFQSTKSVVDVCVLPYLLVIPRDVL